MGIRKRIKDFRNWCPQTPDRLPTKLKSYSAPIAVVLAATLIFGVSFSLLSSQFIFSHSVPQIPVVEQPTDNSSQPSASPTPAPETNSTALISKEEALSIAMPIIDKYAQENNRTITSVDASLGQTSTMSDITGHFANPSHPMASNPSWLINAQFATIGDPNSIRLPNGTNPTNDQYWITGYQVSLWANNGQVFSSNVLGFW